MSSTADFSFDVSEIVEFDPVYGNSFVFLPSNMSSSADLWFEISEVVEQNPSFNTPFAR